MDIVSRIFDPDLWEIALQWDMPSFLQAYTLHDSHLEGFHHSPSAGVVVFIAWDLHWNKNIPASCRRLVIAFPAPCSLTWTEGSWRQSTLDGAVSEIVPALERERMLSDGSVEIKAFQGSRDEIQPCAFDPTLTRTVFQGMNWSRLIVLHGAESRFLCLDDTGSVFAIPTAVTAPDAAAD